MSDRFYEYPAFVTVRAARSLDADVSLFDALRQIERFIADNKLDIIIDIDDGEPVDVTEDRT
jgi:hypothetical protein